MGQLFQRRPINGRKKQATNNKLRYRKDDNRNVRAKNLSGIFTNEPNRFEDRVMSSSGRIGKNEERIKSLESVLQKKFPHKIINMVEEYAQELQIAGHYVASFFGNQNHGRILKPSGIALSKENVYVANTGRKYITVYSFEGKFIQEWFYESNLMKMTPARIIISDNEVYVSDAIAQRIYIFDLMGKYLRELKAFALNIAVAEDRIYLCSNTGIMKIYSRDGYYIGEWNVLDHKNNPVMKVKGFTIFSGRIYLCDYNGGRILIFSLNGSYIKCWDVPGRRETQPCAVTVLHGVVYVSDKRYNRIYAMDSSGNYIRRYGSRFDPSPLCSVNDIAINENALFVCDYKTNAICIFR